MGDLNSSHVLCATGAPPLTRRSTLPLTCHVHHLSVITYQSHPTSRIPYPTSRIIEAEKSGPPPLEFLLIFTCHFSPFTFQFSHKACTAPSKRCIHCIHCKHCTSPVLRCQCGLWELQRAESRETLTAHRQPLHITPLTN